MPFPPSPAHEEAADACCGACGSLFHSTASHEVLMTQAKESGDQGVDPR